MPSYTGSSGVSIGGAARTSLLGSTVFKERDQNPVENDTVRLRLYTFNSNAPSDVWSLDAVKTYLLDPQAITEENPDGRTLVGELDPLGVVHEGVGSYYIDVPLGYPSYTIGNYLDVWTYTADPTRHAQTTESRFRIWPSLWHATPTPVVYDWTFFFRPNRVRKGARQNILVEAHSNAPRATELQAYYENLATAMANLNVNNSNNTFTVTMEQVCGACLPAERDLRVVLENQPVNYRGLDGYGYFFLDTTDIDPGIYSLTFTLNLWGQTFVSPAENFQIYV